MIDWYFQVTEIIAVGGGLLAVFLGLIGRLPSLVSLSPLALSVLGLIVQAFITIGVLVSGNSAKGDVIEFYGYLLTAILVGGGAGFWALAERSKFSTMIMGAANLTIGVMLLRMWQIWFGA
jgi:hypothetical protein